VSVEIIDVELRHKSLNLSPGLNAGGAVTFMGESWITVKFAIVVVHSIKKAFGDNVEVEKCFWKGRVCVDVPVSAAITNHHTLYVDA